MNELPEIATSTSNASTYTLGNVTFSPAYPAFTSTCVDLARTDYKKLSSPFQKQEPIVKVTEGKPMSNRRIVQVFIADPNENIPLVKCLLYQSEEPQLTDLTDQELFFDIDIKSILSKHNEYRITVVDKEASEGKSKDIMLEPAKIRDLKMIVVEVAKL